jgi:hypothetical protein
VNPWCEIPHRAPFVVPADELIIERFNRRVDGRYRVHLEVPPEPFLGCRSAPVVLLNLNPGFDGTELATFADRRFVDAHLANLRHQRCDWPFVWLNPTLSPAAGYRWWHQKLAPLIGIVGQERVAAGVLCLEWFGYHSARFGAAPPCPSQSYASRSSTTPSPAARPS